MSGKCPDCNQPWEEHDFGVPRPFCPDSQAVTPKQHISENRAKPDGLEFYKWLHIRIDGLSKQRIAAIDAGDISKAVNIGAKRKAYTEIKYWLEDH